MPFYIRYPSTTAANPSVGLTGVTAPTSATEIGIIDSSGNLQPVSATTPIPTSSPINANGSMSVKTVTTVEGSLAAPANAIGVIFEAESGNAGNIRWGVSNSAVAILSATLGLLMEPGRDAGFLPFGTGTYLHYISVAAGVNKLGIQWILSA